MSAREAISGIYSALQNDIVGQEHLLEAMLVALLADGHILVEGPPGLAKTRAINSLAKACSTSFHRLQFTPDLLPSDITGTDIFMPDEGEFKFSKGPIFHNLVLADEINRAPAKVQSALLEAMAERQVSVGSKSYPLPSPFLVMATQNPVEQEGTYPLPEAQLDRFLLKVVVDYPGADDELAVLQLTRRERAGDKGQSIDPIAMERIFEARDALNQVTTTEAIDAYIIDLVLATRRPDQYSDELAGLIEYGASPRATIALDLCAKARAWLQGRDYVTPEDVQTYAYPVLRHRIISTYQAEADNLSPDDIIAKVIASVAVG